MSAPELAVSRCGHCHGAFLPRLGRCPRCGSLDVRPWLVRPIARVRAATALESPPPGFAAPHPLVLAELTEEVLLLAVGFLPLPSPGTEVIIRRDGERYLAEPFTREG